MEYAALFLWLGLCLVLGGLIHAVTDGALCYRPVRIVAAPGLIVRKLSMTMAAVLAGGTLRRACIYNLGERQIEFDAEGPSGPARVLVPLAPLFGCAAALTALNGALGHPLDLSYSVPPFTALDAAGGRDFLTATWAMLANVVREFMRQGWRAPQTYLLLALTFSLALGGSGRIEELKAAGLGAVLLAVALALLAAVSARHGPGGVITQPDWFAATRNGLLNTAAVAFVMMVYGMLTALVVGIAVRTYEVLARRNTGEAAPSIRTQRDSSRRRAA
jgi:hypothetical protein